MAEPIERQIPFSPDDLEVIKEIGKQEGRAFKHQAAQLIKEALAARQDRTAK